MCCAVRWETDQLLSIPSRTRPCSELDLWAEEFGSYQDEPVGIPRDVGIASVVAQWWPGRTERAAAVGEAGHSQWVAGAVSAWLHIIVVVWPEWCREVPQSSVF